jgi:glutathione S-transferase
MSDQRKLYYTHNLNPRVAVAVARHLCSPLDYVRFEPMGADRELCRPLNPNTLAPVLVEGERSLWETDAIAMRLSALSGAHFWPSDRQEEVMMWVSWSAHHFTLAGSTFYFENIIVPRFMGRPSDTDRLREAGEDFARFAAVLEAALADRDWLVGNALSYADFRVATALPFAQAANLPVAGYRHIERWHDRLNQLDAWRAPFDGLD